MANRIQVQPELPFTLLLANIGGNWVGCINALGLAEVRRKLSANSPAQQDALVNAFVDKNMRRAAVGDRWVFFTDEASGSRVDILYSHLKRLFNGDHFDKLVRLWVPPGYGPRDIGFWGGALRSWAVEQPDLHFAGGAAAVPATPAADPEPGDAEMAFFKPKASLDSCARGQHPEHLLGFIDGKRGCWHCNKVLE